MRRRFERRRINFRREGCRFALFAHFGPCGRIGRKPAHEVHDPPSFPRPVDPAVLLEDFGRRMQAALVDSRLLHGQVATAWTKTTGPNRIIVVSDGVAHDDLRKSMIREAAPPGVKANVVPISKMIQVSKDTRFGNTKALLLFETPQDALAAIKGGVDIKELNIGSMAHSVGKVAVSKVLSLDEKDIETFEELKKLGVKFDVRKVPSDSQDNMDEILKKAKAELAK